MIDSDDDNDDDVDVGSSRDFYVDFRVLRRPSDGPSVLIWA